jgi:S1-C subfamily serine protease
MTVLILFAALGAAFSGTVLYAYYDYRLNKEHDEFTKLKSSVADEFRKDTAALQAEREDAKAQVRKELEPLTKIAAEGSTLSDLLKKVSPSIYFVHTLDESGQPSVGSAFVVAADGQQTLLLTSFNTVRAATKQPGPDVFVKHGTEGDQKATVWTWQPERDLALLILHVGNEPTLPWASSDSAIHTGDRVFAVSGLGAAGGAISQGFVADISQAGIQHDVPVGAAFQGGPLVDGDGHVVGIASRAYSPLGFTSDAVFFAPTIRMACDKVLKCPSGQASGAGTKS